jgi:hypothetical protein
VQLQRLHLLEVGTIRGHDVERLVGLAAIFRTHFVTERRERGFRTCFPQPLFTARPVTRYRPLMRLQAAMLVDYAAVRSDELLYIIGGGTDHVTIDEVPKRLNIGVVVVLDLEHDSGAMLDFSFSAGDDEPQHTHRHNVVWTGESSAAVGAPRLARLCLALPAKIDRAERHRITITDGATQTTLTSLSFGVALGA